MRKVAYICLLLFSLAGMFLAGSWHSRSAGDESGATETRKVLYYVDPMNPSHTSDKPGVAPCGMAMEPVYADEGMASEEILAPGAVRISAQKQQLIGVQVSPVEEKSHTETLRTIGRVAPDERLVHRLLAGAPGYICDVSEVMTDSYVKKDQWLASFSSPDSIPSMQAFILALNSVDNMRQNNSERSAESLESGATYQLRLEKMVDLGMSRIQMEELRQTRAVPRKIRILSPIDGFVLSRNVSPDQRFERGEEWFRIADLNHVWIVAEVFEREARYIRPGMKARVSLPHRGKVYDATVTYVPPQYDAVGRTLRVRLETDNPENVLRPDMFVDVEFLIEFPPAVTVSADAVLDTGMKKSVFVDLGNGRFEPRTVETGWRFGDQVEILGGLMPGERIVVSGNFLIDSESRMKLAASGLYGAVALDPVCRTDIEVEKASMAGLTKEYNGKVFHFCSDICKMEFEKDPAGSIARSSGKDPVKREIAGVCKGVALDRGMNGRESHINSSHEADHPIGDQSAAPGQDTKGVIHDHVCGMPMPEQWAKSKGLTSEHRGTVYFFCSKECKTEFEKDPERYLSSQGKVNRAMAASGAEGRHP